MRGLGIAAMLAASNVHGQSIFLQESEGATPVPLPDPVRAELDDPFLTIALDRADQPRSLPALVAALTEGGQASVTSFVVGEQIGRPEQVLPGCGQALRRLVLSFDGTHAPSGTPLASNVFVSTFLTPSGIVGDLEVMGWDQTHGAYNYYKLESDTWRFRNSSRELSGAPGAFHGDGCLACHVNGGPVMKEFTFPWNNWHGFPTTFVAPYLQPGSPGAWPSASDPLVARMESAAVLEVLVDSSLQRFAGSLIEARIDTASDGSVAVTGLRQLADSLFMPTELNLGSSITKSGLDEGGLTTPAVTPIPIPDMFFANIAQLRDLEIPVLQGQGLVTQIFTPGSLGLTLDEYQTLLAEFDIDTDCMPGRDTLFAWFGPEPSEFDRRMVERLVKRRVLDETLVAATLAIDVGQPLFSEARAALFTHLPDQVSAPDRAALPGAVRAAVIASLEATPARTDAEEDYLGLLKGDALPELNRRVEAWRDEVRDRLDPSDPVARMAALRALFQQLIDNRAAFESAEISARLAEFPGLFPTP